MRTKPYTVAGLRRVPCSRCGAPSRYQWQICSLDHRVFRPLCEGCDVAVNELVVRFVFGTAREAELAAYREKVLGVADGDHLQM